MAVKSLKKRVQGEAYAIVFLQLLGVGTIALLGLIFKNWHIGLALLAGGLAYALPNLFFVWRVFRYAGASQMGQFMAAFFVGEIIKLFISGILALMIVKILPVSLLSVLAGFIGAIVAFWAACMWYFSKRKTFSPSTLLHGAAR